MKELVETGTFENVPGMSYKNNGKIIHNAQRPKLNIWIPFLFQLDV